MREDGNTDSEAVLKRKFMSMLVGAYDIETALDCRPEVREVYKSLQISSGSLFDIDYPPYSLKEELANDDRPFSPDTIFGSALRITVLNVSGYGVGKKSETSF